MSGARGGVILALASAASIVANYVFLLAAGRLLGSESYGSLAALLGLLAVILIPASALQMAVSRDVSRRLASGDSEGASNFARRILWLSTVATVPLVLVAVALAVPVSNVLNIDSVGVVILAELTLTTALVTPVAMGTLQGQQRFHALATMYLAPVVLRLLLFAALAVAGYRLGGAVVATVVSAVVSVALALALTHLPLAGVSKATGDVRPFVRYLGPVTIGLIGIALLTHVDLLIVKARFLANDAGAYAAASAFARVGLFLPATILAVIFPRTAARQARGEETSDILGRSLLVTAVFCGGLSLFYWATGRGLVTTTFGIDFAKGGEILPGFALAIGLFSLANILVGYHLSRGEAKYAWIVAGGVVVQVAVLSVVPSSLHDVVFCNLGVGVGLLAVHELVVGSSAPAVAAGLRRFGAGLALRLRDVALETALVVVATTAFVCALFWPVVAHLSSTIIGAPGADSTGGAAWLWQLDREGAYHLLGTTHHTLTGAPFGWDESNGLNIQWLLPYYPAYLATQLFGSIAALNLVVLSGLVLSGCVMYALARYLGCSPLVSAWAAMAYIIFPWHLARTEHASLVHIEVLALLVLALVAAARTPTWTRFVFIGLATLACWLTSGYYGAEAVIAAAAFAVGAALVVERRNALKLVTGYVGGALSATALIGVVALATGTGTGAGIGRVVGDLSIYGLRPSELVIPPASSFLFGDAVTGYWSTRMHGSNPTEITNYLGLLTFALALAWLILAARRWRGIGDKRRIATAGLLAVLLAGVLFAAPSPVLIFGHEIWTPSRLLYKLVPAFRVPSRWDPLLMTALAPIAALALQAMCVGLRRRTPWRWATRALAIGAMAVSLAELAIRPAEARFRTTPVPPEYAALEKTPPGVVAEYPLGYSDIYRLFQQDHGRPLLNSNQVDTPGDYARLVLLDPRERGTAASLSLLGVTAIAIHPQAQADVEVPPREPNGIPGYKLVGRFASGNSIFYPGRASVWQVVAQPAPALVTLPGGFAKPVPSPEGASYALVSPAGVGVLEFTAKHPSVVRLTFFAMTPKDAQRDLRLANSDREVAFPVSRRTPISILVSIPRGRSTLLVKTDPPATSVADAISISTPRAAEAAGAQADLEADLASPDPGF